MYPVERQPAPPTLPDPETPPKTEGANEKGGVVVAATAPPAHGTPRQTTFGPAYVQPPATSAARRDIPDSEPPDTEEEVARHVAGRLAECFRYDVDLGQWFGLEHGTWHRDQKSKHFEVIRLIMRDLALRLTGVNRRPPRFLASGNGISSVVRLASMAPTLRVCQSEWDADPFLAGTPEGVLDLRSGCILPRAGVELVSRRLSVSPDPGVECPVFRRFLGEVSGGREEVARYLLRWFGYALTGSTKEQAFLFIHGSGQNGKSMLLDLLRWIMGDYAEPAPMWFFTRRPFVEHGCETAVLAGARLVTASETDSDQTWDASKLKQFTGGDALSARLMRQNPFKFVPRFKLMFAGNHKPTLVESGPAMARRLHLLHFGFVPSRPDPELAEKLRREGPGILSMIIREGLGEWSRIGLAPPPVVREQAAEYLAEQDHVGMALDDRFEFSPEAGHAEDKAWFVPTFDVRMAVLAGFSANMNRGGLPDKTLADALQSKGCKRSRSPVAISGKGVKQRGWFGLRPRPDATQQPPYGPLALTSSGRGDAA